MNEAVAIYALDGGTTSGVARGIFPAKSESVWDGLAAGEWESWEVEGEPARQAWEIIGEYAEWLGWPHLKPMEKKGVHQHILAFEDFVVRLGTGASSKRSLLDPVRVSSACDALCIQRDGLRWAFPQYQQPSQAKNFATNERLRKHKLWVKGSDHRRDAVRHMCLAYSVSHRSHEVKYPTTRRTK